MDALPPPEGLGAIPAEPAIPAPLWPRPEESELVARAERLLAALAPHAGAERLDPRFGLGLADLVAALRALEGLRARGFGAEAAQPALAALGQVIGACEEAVAAALPALEAERRREGRGPGARSARRLSRPPGRR